MAPAAQEKTRREVLVFEDRARIHAAAFLGLPSASWMCTNSFSAAARAATEKVLTGLAHARVEKLLSGPEEEALSAEERRELERIERFYLQEILGKGGA